MEFDPAGVKLTVPFVPAGVKLAVAFIGTPAGHATVPAGVPAETAEVVSKLPVNVSAGTEKLLPGEEPPTFENAPVLDPARLPEVVATDAVPFVPVGVTVCVWVASALPAKVGTPAGQEIVSAGTVPALPENVSAGTVPAFPVNVGAATLPAGVKLAVAFDPVGVIVFAPPVPPTSPFAAIVP